MDARLHEGTPRLVTHASPRRAPRRTTHILRTGAADRVVEQFEDDTLADLQIPVFAVDVTLVEEDVAARRADDAAPLAAAQQLDATFGRVSDVNGFRAAIGWNSIRTHQGPSSSGWASDERPRRVRRGHAAQAEESVSVPRFRRTRRTRRAGHSRRV